MSRAAPRVVSQAVQQDRYCGVGVQKRCVFLSPCHTLAPPTLPPNLLLLLALVLCSLSPNFPTSLKFQVISEKHLFSLFLTSFHTAHSYTLQLALLT